MSVGKKDCNLDGSRLSGKCTIFSIRINHKTVCRISLQTVFE